MTDSTVVGDADLAAFRERVRDWLATEAPRHGWLREPGRSRRRIGGDDHEQVARNRECQRLLYEAGLAGLSWPVEYGGQGLGLREQIVFSEESRAFDLPLALYIIGLGMCGPTILAVGTEEQKQTWIRPMLDGTHVWCQLFSEPDAGSDVAGVRARAVHDGDGWVLNGQKVWTSGAMHSDYGIVLARTDPDVPKHEGLTMFIVDMRADGLSMRPIRQIDGGEHFNEVFFDDVRIPDENVLGGVGQGWRAATATLMNERVSLGAVRPLDDVHPTSLLIEYAQRTGQAADGGTRRELADLWMREQVVGLFSERITSAILAGQQPGPEGSAAKLVRTDFSKRSATLGARLAGPAATSWMPGDEHGSTWATTLLFVPSLSVAGGTDEVLRNIIGERVLGLPREPQVDRDVAFRDLKGVTA